MPRPIYMDCFATTPVSARVRAAMEPYSGGVFANPHALQHGPGQEAAAAVRKAREQVAQAMGASPDEIIFTSGATESNNMVLRGAAKPGAKAGKRRILISAIEHPSVREPAFALRGDGFIVEEIPVVSQGFVKAATLGVMLGCGDDVALVSVMAANNETGVGQDVLEMAELCRGKGVPFHTDAVQALGKLPFDLHLVPASYASFSAHKLYGPKGVGALFMRKSASRLAPLLLGGGQEGGMRAGTVAVSLVAGFGEACAEAMEMRDSEAVRLNALRDEVLQALMESFPGMRLHGCLCDRVPGSLNIGFPGVPAGLLMEMLPEFALSAGSACHSGSDVPSHVLVALGLSPEEAGEALRISPGRMTTEGDMGKLVFALTDAVRQVKGMKRVSP